MKYIYIYKTILMYIQINFYSTAYVHNKIATRSLIYLYYKKLYNNYIII